MRSFRAETPADIPRISRLLRAAFGADLEGRRVDALRTEVAFTPEISRLAV